MNPQVKKVVSVQGGASEPKGLDDGGPGSAKALALDLPGKAKQERGL